MVVSVREVALGAVICDRCGKRIDTADTNKVKIYYSRCKDEQCNNLYSQVKKKADLICLGTQQSLTSPEVIQASQQLDCLLNQLWHEENKILFSRDTDTELQVTPSLYQSKRWFLTDIDQVLRMITKK